jgi:hypothetical protein
MIGQSVQFLYMMRRILVGRYAPDSQTPTVIGRSVQVPVHGDTDTDWLICSGSYTRRDGL